MMFFASLKMMLLHFVPQWCDVCPMCRQAHIIRRSRHHWRKPTSCAEGKHHSKNAPLSVDKSAFFVGGGRGIRTPVGLPPNGFQDFLKKPTLTQNNRKYQTVENAENPVNSSVFTHRDKKWTLGKDRYGSDGLKKKVITEEILWWLFSVWRELTVCLLDFFLFLW